MCQRIKHLTLSYLIFQVIYSREELLSIALQMGPLPPSAPLFSSRLRVIITGLEHKQPQKAMSKLSILIPVLSPLRTDAKSHLPLVTMGPYWAMRANVIVNGDPLHATRS